MIQLKLIKYQNNQDNKIYKINNNLIQMIKIFNKI